jgi:hypothetical protein
VRRPVQRIVFFVPLSNGADQIVRTRIFIAFVVTMFATPLLARAHPPISVVMDRSGNVFYSDLKRVWIVSPTTGQKSIAVPNVHSHELFLDSAGNLFGEHTWYDDRTKKWSFRVWKRAANGDITDVIPAKEGFRTDYSFVRDSTGAMYFATSAPAGVWRRAQDGKVTLLSRGPFTDIRWMAAAADGTLHLIDDGNLKRVRPGGAVETVAPRLASRSLLRFNVAKHHIVMGLWLDSGNNVYAASYGSGEVKRITPKGDVTVISESALPWGPTGGMVSPAGDLWILETNILNEVRLKRISRNGSVRYY